DAVERVEAGKLHGDLHGAAVHKWLAVVVFQKTAFHDQFHEARGDGEVDLRAGNAGHGDADQVSRRVDHRPARVARMHAAVDLDLLQCPGRVLAQARYRRLADGDVLAQLRAEGEAEDVALLRLDQGPGQFHAQRRRQVPFHAQHGQVAGPIDADHLAGKLELVGLAAVEDDVDVLGWAAAGLQHAQHVGIGD